MMTIIKHAFLYTYLNLNLRASLGKLRRTTGFFPGMSFRLRH